MVGGGDSGVEPVDGSIPVHSECVLAQDTQPQIDDRA